MTRRVKVSAQLLTVAVAAIGACGSVTARAQQAPVPSPEDNRIAILRYAPGSPAQLRAIAGVELAVLMPRGEHVQRVTVGDPSAVRVEVPGDHDGIVLSALRPLNDVALSVETEQQSYQFSVSVNLKGTVPWLVRLERSSGMVHNIFPTAPLSVGAPPPPQPPGQWKLKGDKKLEPVMIRDNGEKVSIKWSPMQAIPAVFALDDHGQEQMVNGYMRADLFVIDRVFDHLVFRIDKAMAHADRIAIEPKK